MTHHNGTEEPGGADEVGAAHDALYTGPIGLPPGEQPVLVTKTPRRRDDAPSTASA